MHTFTITLITIAGTLALSSLAGCKKNSCAQVIVEVAGDHGHSVVIPTDHVKRGIGGNYDARGSADHDHGITLRDSDMRALQAGDVIQTVASSARAHTHPVKIQCQK